MKKHSIRATLGNLLCAALALLVVLALPTGWLYALWAGTGTEQGQRPGEGVEQIRTREDIEKAFFAKIPSTVNGGQLALCPLARLRDIGQEGIHYHHNGGAKSSVYISEYCVSDDPIPIWKRLVQWGISGAYNQYYLIELGDNSWLCVYFDDYYSRIRT